MSLIRSSRDLDDGRELVACPYCDYEYVHFKGIEFSGPTAESSPFSGPTGSSSPLTVTSSWREDRPGVLVQVHAGQLLSLDPSLPRSSRRGAITLVFDGECGHSFALTIEQHKGMEFVHVSRLTRREEVLAPV